MPPEASWQEQEIPESPLIPEGVSTQGAQPAPTRPDRHDGVDASSAMWLDVAMKRVKIAELKDHLSRHLREVERGAEVEVTDRDRPIARIVPVREAGVGVVVLPSRRPFSPLRRRRYPPARWRVSSTELLLEERQRR